VSTGVGVPVPTGRLQILAATRPRNEASCWTTTATKTQCRTAVMILQRVWRRSPPVDGPGELDGYHSRVNYIELLRSSCW